MFTHVRLSLLLLVLLLPQWSWGVLVSYSAHPCSPGHLLAVGGDNLWVAAHSEESFALVPTCDAAMSGFHSAPPSAQTQQTDTQSQTHTLHYKRVEIVLQQLLTWTWISWMMLLNWAERSIHVFTSSMARSKFFTYSPYIFRNGASFCKMSPIRGFEFLHTDTFGIQLKCK